MKGIFFFFILAYNFLYAQNIISNVQNCFVQDYYMLFIKENTLNLINLEQKETYTYNDFVLSSIIDIYSNNGFLNTILTEQQIILLDNKLTVIKKIQIPNTIIKPWQIVIESAHYIWIYDSFENKLIKINTTNEKIIFSLLLNNYCNSILEMIYKQNKVYFLCEKALFSLDYLYNINMEINIQASDFIFYKNQILLLVNGQIQNRKGQILSNAKEITQLFGYHKGALLVNRSDTCQWIKLNINK